MPVRIDFEPGEFCWIDLVAHDLEAAASWYAGLFDWSHFMMDSPGEAPPYAFFQKGEAVIGGLGEMNDEMKQLGIPPMWNSYIATDDCEALEAKVKEAGGTVTVPTMDVPGHGKLAFFMDPEGGSFAAWQTTTKDSQGVLIGDPGSLSWNELMTRDSKRAQEFYKQVAGWDFSPMPMGDVDYTMIKLGDKDAGGIMPMEGPQFEGIPAHWLVYFAVDDCEATAKRAQATGGRINVPPTPIPVGKFSVLADPQGAVFCVIELTQAQA